MIKKDSEISKPNISVETKNEENNQVIALSPTDKIDTVAEIKNSNENEENSPKKEFKVDDEFYNRNFYNSKITIYEGGNS